MSALKISEKELEKLGLSIVGQNIAPKPADSAPLPEWDDTRLLAYTRGELANVDAHEQSAAVHLWQAGAALSALRERRKKSRDWQKWCESNGIAYSTAWEAITVYKRVTLEELKGLAITEAKVKAGVLRRRKRKGKAEKVQTEPESDQGDQEPDQEPLPIPGRAVGVNVDADLVQLDAVVVLLQQLGRKIATAPPKEIGNYLAALTEVVTEATTIKGILNAYKLAVG